MFEDWLCLILSVQHLLLLHNSKGETDSVNALITDTEDIAMNLYYTPRHFAMFSVSDNNAFTDPFHLLNGAVYNIGLG